MTVTPPTKVTARHRRPPASTSPPRDGRPSHRRDAPTRAPCACASRTRPMPQASPSRPASSASTASSAPANPPSASPARPRARATSSAAVKAAGKVTAPCARSTSATRVGFRGPYGNVVPGRRLEGQERGLRRRRHRPGAGALRHLERARPARRVRRRHHRLRRAQRAATWSTSASSKSGPRAPTSRWSPPSTPAARPRLDRRGRLRHAGRRADGAQPPTTRWPWSADRRSWSSSRCPCSRSWASPTTPSTPPSRTA